MTPDRIRICLGKQINHQGLTDDNRLLLQVLDVCKTHEQWAALTRFEFRKIGPDSTNIMFYPNAVLRGLQSTLSQRTMQWVLTAFTAPFRIPSLFVVKSTPL
ncbi:MAG: hypothetical protein AB8B85_02785, partial [Paracoccaceae bacterium]